jgi:hypothetical protein
MWDPINEPIPIFARRDSETPRRTSTRTACNPTARMQAWESPLRQILCFRNIKGTGFKICWRDKLSTWFIHESDSTLNEFFLPHTNTQFIFVSLWSRERTRIIRGAYETSVFIYFSFFSFFFCVLSLLPSFFLCNSAPFYRFLYNEFDSPGGGLIRSTQRRFYLHATTKNSVAHECPERDQNPRTQCSSGIRLCMECPLGSEWKQCHYGICGGKYGNYSFYVSTWLGAVWTSLVLLTRISFI